MDRPASRPAPDKCLDLDQLDKILRTSTDPKEILDAWQGWHAIARPIRPLFRRYVELGNKGAHELKFSDTGAMWRSKYDMPPDAFAAEMDRLWEQVRPLYLSLHAYVRAKLREKYGDVVPGVDYSHIVPLLLEAVKAQQKEIDELKRKVDAQGAVKP